jgi:hypothetical protein
VRNVARSDRPSRDRKSIIDERSDEFRREQFNLAAIGRIRDFNVDDNHGSPPARKRGPGESVPARQPIKETPGLSIRSGAGVRSTARRVRRRDNICVRYILSSSSGQRKSSFSDERCWCRFQNVRQFGKHLHRNSGRSTLNLSYYRLLATEFCGHFSLRQSELQSPCPNVGFDNIGKLLGLHVHVPIVYLRAEYGQHGRRSFDAVSFQDLATS